MDDAIVRSLLDALAKTPDNAALRIAVIRALHAAKNARAAEYVDGLDARALAAPDRAFVGGVLVAPACRARARVRRRRRAGGPDRARAGAARARRPDRRARGVRGRSEGEPDARGSRPAPALVAKATVHGGGDGPRLRVLSNDETDEARSIACSIPSSSRSRSPTSAGSTRSRGQIEKRIILPFQKPALFAKFKKKAGGGILMYGPPGCGKTLLARATAGQCNATFLNVAIEDVLDMYIGESERKLHALFEKARAATPAVLFFDEIEALAASASTREASTA